MSSPDSPSSRAETFEPRLGWRTSTAWGACLIAAYLIIACLPVVLAMAEREGSGRLLWELGLGAALLGFSLLCLQVILAGRFRTIDGPFGLDMVMLLHKSMALLAGALILAHPILLSLDMGTWFLWSMEVSWPIWLGKAALILLVVAVIYALLVRLWPDLQYQTWRRIHKGMVVVLALGFVHSMVVGSDVEETGLRMYWYALFAVAAGVYVWRNLVVALWTGRRFRVTDVQQASHDTYTLRLEPADGKALPPRNPGQFMFLKLIRPGRPGEEHPFTISASPTESGHLAATIKESGDFTNTIGQTRPGDEARVEHPFGRFSHVRADAPRLAFIAGGVGITPIRSMLRCLADSGDRRPVLLICANKTQRDILFRNELESLGRNVRVVHVLSEPDASWSGETGYVTRDVLAGHAEGLLEEAHFYVCGPVPMRNMVVKALRQLRVDPSRIHYERFSL